MILGADLVRFVLSGEGLAVFVAVAAAWIFAANSRAARAFLYTIAICYVLASVPAVSYPAGKQLARGFHRFRPSDVPAGARTAIVVLGAGSVTVGDWWGENFSIAGRTSAQRVLEASHVYRAIGAAMVISSGGETHPSPRRAPDAQTMRAALVQLGVPAEHIQMETASRTTRDEAVIVAGMLKNQPVDRIVLVTSESHMRRALGAFRAAGVECVPAVAAEFDLGDGWTDHLLPSHRGLDASAVIVHELLGLGYYAARGWLR